MTSLFVGNLSFTVTETDLQSVFERHGRVSGVRLVTDLSTGKSKGFAFVRMRNLDDADEAQTRLNGYEFKGRSLVVKEATGRSDTRPAPVMNRWHLV